MELKPYPETGPLLRDQGGPSHSNNICIFKIPRVAGELDEELYLPSMIGFGPWHGSTDKKCLKEDYKTRFLVRIKKTIDDVQHEIKEIQEDLEHCYEGFVITTVNEKEEFIKRMAIDGCVMLEFLIMAFYEDKSLKPHANQFLHDLVLLQNQLPMILLKKIYSLAMIVTPSLSELICDYFQAYNTKAIPHQHINAKHFIDLMRSFFLPSWIHSGYKRQENALGQVYNLSKLLNSGVKLKIGEDKAVSDVQFKGRNLTMPTFVVDSLTETRLRNIIVFEGFYYPQSPYVIDHFYMLKSLIQTKEDVNTLVKHQILANLLNDDGKVVEVIARLGTNSSFEGMDKHLFVICEALHDFQDDPDNVRKALIERKYCNSLCKRVTCVVLVVALVAGVINYKFIVPFIKPFL